MENNNVYYMEIEMIEYKYISRNEKVFESIIIIK